MPTAPRRGRRAREADPTPARVSVVEVVLYGVLASVVAGGTLVLLEGSWGQALASTAGGLVLTGVVGAVMAGHEGRARRGYRGARRRQGT